MADLQGSVLEWDRAVWLLTALSLTLREDGPWREQARELVDQLGLLEERDGDAAPSGPQRSALSGQAAAPVLQGAKLLTMGAAWDDQSEDSLLAQGRASAQFGPLFVNAVLPRLSGLEARLGGAEAKILDVGVGAGFLAASLLEVLPAARLVGIDVMPRALRLAERTLEGYGERAELRLQDVSSLPDTQAYDLAWLPCPFVPEAPLKAGVPRVAASLRSGGWIVMGHGKFSGDRVLDAVNRFKTAVFGGTALSDLQAQELLEAAGLEDVATLDTPLTAPALTVGRAP